MAPRSISSLLAGAIFGAAMTAAGIYTPDVIISQMQLRDFLMLKVFLTATGAGALIMVAAKRLGVADCKSRSPSSWGWFGRHDGNIVGGIMLGAGMTLTGACPGTVLAQLATGVRSGLAVAGGALLGGVLYSGFGQHFKREAKIVDMEPKTASSTPKLTVYEQYGISEIPAALGLTGLCAAAVFLAEYFFPHKSGSLLSPVAGGLAIASAQAASLLLTSNTLGCSSSYAQAGDFIWWTVSSERGQRPGLGNVVFVTGVLAGSWALAHAVSIPIAKSSNVSTLQAIVGGALLIIGSRVAGGCTSGHGISGMATLSISSFITVAAMFIGAMGLAAML